MKIIADENIPFVRDFFASIGEVQLVKGRQLTAEVVADAEILLVRSVTKVNSKLLTGSKIRFVGTATIGFDHVDTEYLSRSNLGFASAPGSNANSASEYVIAALLEIAQRHKITLQGKSIGIVGVGNVGSRVATKCAALGMKVSLNDPPLARQTGDSKYLPIERLFESDFITLHTPLAFDGIDKTFHLADENFFKSLKRGCVFVNASRGGVVETEALKAAIKAGRLKAVALDVWENEPNIGTELLEMVDIGTPHIAGYSLDGKITGVFMIYKAVCDYFGLPAKHDTTDFLPRPDVPEMVINDKDDEQGTLYNAVRNIYNISEDDSRLRQVCRQPAEKQGEFFDHLRKNYPVRREFQNTKVFVAKSCCCLAQKLEGLGFKVTDEQR